MYRRTDKNENKTLLAEVTNRHVIQPNVSTQSEIYIVQGETVIYVTSIQILFLLMFSLWCLSSV